MFVVAVDVWDGVQWYSLLTNWTVLVKWMTRKLCYIGNPNVCRQVVCVLSEVYK